MAQGDHLYVEARKPGFFHCGIDTGEGTVVDFWGAIPEEAFVSEVSMQQFSNGSPLFFKTYFEPCYHSAEVVRRARSWIGKPLGYSLDESNCEHFATWCKVGRWESQQVVKVKGGINEGFKLAAGTLGVYILLKFLDSE